MKQSGVCSNSLAPILCKPNKTQTQINLGDYNKPQEQTKAVGIGKILGKIINIKDFRTNRGKPSPYTPKDAIGEDGMTDYNVIDTVETFDVNNQQVSSFFVTPAIVKQIQRVRVVSFI